MKCERQREKIALWQILLPYRYYANNYYINQLTTDLSGFHSQGREQKLGRKLGEVQEHGKHVKLGRCFSLIFNLGKSTFSLTILNKNIVNSFTEKRVLRQILFLALFNVKLSRVVGWPIRVYLEHNSVITGS